MGHSFSNEVHPLALSVLAFADWDIRLICNTLSRRWKVFMQQDIVYRWFCVCLIEENGLYSSLKVGINGSWKKLFKDLYILRNLWTPAGVKVRNEKDHQHSERFKVSVYTRFRPLDSDKTIDEGFDVTLPLHQRLELIRLSYGTKSRKETLRILKEEGNWFGKKWAYIEAGKENSHGNSSRPLTPMSNDHLKASVQSIDSGSGRIVMVAPDVGLREFTFDSVFPPTTSQRHIYEIGAQALVGEVMNGFNASIIMYGQTGSGKTYTMFGDNTSMEQHICKDNEGIVSRACKEILQAVHKRREQNITAEVSISYIEIYGDTITDLLRYGQRCGHSRVAAQQFVLSGASDIPVNNIEDVLHLIEQGDAQKRRAATAMNDRSSRAHSLFIITLKQQKAGSEVTISSRLFLADLGGSEQVKKSQIEAGGTRRVTPSNSNMQFPPGEQPQEYSAGFELGDRMRETVNINLGLLALKKCIEALNNDAPYVPYKDSKLTMLLSAGLGGDCKTSVIVCGNMEPRHASETMAALRFGEKCSLVQMEIRNNATILAGILGKINSEIKQLEIAIIQKERWEVVTEERVDELAEEGTMEAAMGGKERRVVTVLRGAENERIRLGELLIQREQLTGCDDGKLEANSNALGFGRSMATTYGIGKSYNMELEENVENTRFMEETKVDLVPTAVRVKGKKWETKDVDQKTLEKRAKKINRNRSVYSELSL